MDDVRWITGLALVMRKEAGLFSRLGFGSSPQESTPELPWREGFSQGYSEQGSEISDEELAAAADEYAKYMREIGREGLDSGSDEDALRETGYGYGGAWGQERQSGLFSTGAEDFPQFIRKLHESAGSPEKQASALDLALRIRKSAKEPETIGELWKHIGGFRGIRKRLGDGIGDTFLEGDRDGGRRIGDILSHGAIGLGLGTLGGGLVGWATEEPMTREEKRNELAYERAKRLGRRENIAGLGGWIGASLGGLYGNQTWNNERIPYAIQDGVERFGESFQQGLDSFQDKLPGFLRPSEQ